MKRVDIAAAAIQRGMDSLRQQIAVVTQDAVNSVLLQCLVIEIAALNDSFREAWRVDADEEARKAFAPPVPTRLPGDAE